MRTSKLDFDIRTPVLSALEPRSMVIPGPSPARISGAPPLDIPSPAFLMQQPDMKRMSPHAGRPEIFSPRQFWQSPVSKKRKKKSLPPIEEVPLQMPPAFLNTSADETQDRRRQAAMELRQQSKYSKHIAQSPVLPPNEMELSLSGRRHTMELSIPKAHSDAKSLNEYSFSIQSKYSPHLAGTTAIKMTQEMMEAQIEIPDSTLGKSTAGNGSSCHQCKSRRALGLLAFCCNSTKAKGVKVIRPCRKKYCYTCLNKFYNESVASENASWLCPACRKQCVCAACKRHTGPDDAGSPSFSPSNPRKRSCATSHSPATTVAINIVHPDQRPSNEFILNVVQDPKVQKDARKGAKKILKKQSKYIY